MIVLYVEIDEEVLERMPEWFRVLRDAYSEYARKFYFRGGGSCAAPGYLF